MVFHATPSLLEKQNSTCQPPLSSHVHQGTPRDGLARLAGLRRGSMAATAPEAPLLTLFTLRTFLTFLPPFPLP